MSPHSRQPPRNCERPSIGAASAPSVITMPEPKPLPRAISATTALTVSAECVSGSRRAAMRHRQHDRHGDHVRP